MTLKLFTQCLSVVSSSTYLLDPAGEKTKSAEVQKPIVRQFEISDPIAKACWYKDGTQIYPKSKTDCESQSSIQTLPLQSPDLPPDGGFGCKTFGATQSNVVMKGGDPYYTQSKTQEFSDMHKPTQLIVFSLDLSKQLNSVYMVMRLVR